MAYEFRVTVPANTLKGEPAEAEALLDPGVVVHVECEMANGCHRAVHCVVVQGAFQLWPRNPEGTMSTDAHVIQFEDYYELRRGTNLLLIRCWSPGTGYDHEVKVRFVVLPKKIASMIPVIELLSKMLARMGIL